MSLKKQSVLFLWNISLLIMAKCGIPYLIFLKEKQEQGVEVRLLYDGMGSQFLLPNHYDKYLETKGIKCRIFNEFRPFLSTAQNNRDHRKILVIDGTTAFNGGVNLADEYINEKNVSVIGRIPQ